MRFFRRRKFIIRKKLQYTLLAITFFYAVLLIAVVASSLFIPLMIDMGKGTDPSSKAIQASHIMLYLHENFWPPVLLTLAAIGLHSIRISHKIAGPIYRIDMAFKEMIKKKLFRAIALRHDDYLSEEVATINEAMDGLRFQLNDVKNAHEELSDIIDRSASKLNEASKNEIASYLEEISAKARNVGDKIESIKVTE